MQDHQYIFSVVMPVYNVEEYLEEAIGSVIGQTLGFRDNIQLILVNDGSPDNSGDICSRYASMYPDNIVYVNKENDGVSSARNAGMQYIKGRYVNFMDSDDVWGEDAFERAVDFLTDHADIDIVSARMLYLNKRGQYHLDYEYDTTRVVDINETFDHPLLSVARSFVSAEAIADKRFDERLSVSEDLLFLNELILEKGVYGVIREAVYYYRKRDDGTSALDRSDHNLSYYTDTIDIAWRGIAEESIKKYGCVIPYIQYLLITDMQWRYTAMRPSVLDDEQWSRYKDDIRSILSLIDNDIIISQRRMMLKEKIYSIRLKSGSDAFKTDKELKDTLTDRFVLRISMAEEKDGGLFLTGTAHEKYIDSCYRVYAKDDNGKRYDADYYYSPAEDWEGLPGTVCMETFRFSLKLPLADGAAYNFYIEDGSSEPRKLNIIYGKGAGLGNFSDAFFIAADHIIKRTSAARLRVYGRRFKTEFAPAHRYYKMIEELGGSDLAGLWRESYRLKKKHKKPVWIISDRLSTAGDTGEDLFRYLMGTKTAKDHDIYYLLDKDSEDFQRLEKVGKVLAFGSREHYLQQIAASMIISTCAENWVTDPFGPDQRYFRNLMEHSFVFLQGKKDKGSEPDWESVLNKRVRLINVSSKQDFGDVLKMRNIRCTDHNDIEQIAEETIRLQDSFRK